MTIPDRGVPAGGREPSRRGASAKKAIGGRRAYLALAATALAADQTSKVAADLWLRPRGPVGVIPGCFDLVYTRNPGGLFGYFATMADPWRSLLLTLLPLVAIVFLSVFLVRSERHDRSTLAGLALILGGATGNLVDRLFRGEVVDFLDVYVSWSPVSDWLVASFGTAHWPTFNVADSCIVIGAGLLLVDLVRPDRSAEGPAGAE